MVEGKEFFKCHLTNYFEFQSGCFRNVLNATTETSLPVLSRVIDFKVWLKPPWLQQGPILVYHKCREDVVSPFIRRTSSVSFRGLRTFETQQMVWHCFWWQECIFCFRIALSTNGMLMFKIWFSVASSGVIFAPSCQEEGWRRCLVPVGSSGIRPCAHPSWHS